MSKFYYSHALVFYGSQENPVQDFLIDEFNIPREGDAETIFAEARPGFADLIHRAVFQFGGTREQRIERLEFDNDGTGDLMIAGMGCALYYVDDPAYSTWHKQKAEVA